MNEILEFSSGIIRVNRIWRAIMPLYLLNAQIISGLISTYLKLINALFRLYDQPINVLLITASMRRVEIRW